ncbi:heterokaryon incompatibility protein-domain-containing protein [Leptodontidium sp. 2 PMI_412]|nr:heterokaryon incompatibility protein-domain-containing protein [Leptodontidium sp. 2 PMI_412]
MKFVSCVSSPQRLLFSSASFSIFRKRSHVLTSLSRAHGGTQTIHAPSCLMGTNSSSPFVVTDSLMLALQRPRSRSSSAIVWADAICINQQDIEERNLQVQAMASIYQKAAEVAIWLGPDAGNSNFALQLLRELHNSRTSAGRIRTIIESPD